MTINKELQVHMKPISEHDHENGINARLDRKPISEHDYENGTKIDSDTEKTSIISRNGGSDESLREKRRKEEERMAAPMKSSLMNHKKWKTLLHSHSSRESAMVLVASVLLALNTGYLNGVSLSGLMFNSDSDSTREGVAVAGFTSAYTRVGIDLYKGEWGEYAFQSALILSFIGGGVIEGFITPNPQPWRIEPTYGPTFLIGGMVLGLAIIFAQFQYEKMFFCLAACSCGIQNGITSGYSANLIRSTGLTGTSTDIGVCVGQLLRGNKANFNKLIVLICLAIPFWAGAILAIVVFTTYTARAGRHLLIINALFHLLIGFSLIWYLVKEHSISIQQVIMGTWKWDQILHDLDAMYDEFSDENGEKLMHIFDEMDTDKDGFIDSNELYQALEKHGSSIDKKSVLHVIKCADADGDGRISRDELKLVSKKCKSLPTTRINHTFRKSGERKKR